MPSDPALRRKVSPMICHPSEYLLSFSSRTTLSRRQMQKNDVSWDSSRADQSIKQFDIKRHNSENIDEIQNVRGKAYARNHMLAQAPCDNNPFRPSCRLLIRGIVQREVPWARCEAKDVFDCKECDANYLDRAPHMVVAATAQARQTLQHESDAPDDDEPNDENGPCVR